MDLSLVSIEDLKDEIQSRFDCCIILTEKYEGNNGGRHQFYRSGNEMTAIGLCEVYLNTIKNEIILEHIEKFDED